ncbi:MAG: 2-oxo acid dehydrogenase subunit E2 [Chloroflexi bacterium]|nr:2-oxo acid dehydrogenase subunit E2 [Chloroflexota bacterium]
MPQMGADMTEGTVVRWVKQVGDLVNRGEIIAEIETDKATVELEAFESGIMRKQIVGEGETVPVGEVIAVLGADGEEMPEQVPAPRKQAAETPARRSVEPQAESPQPAAAGVTGDVAQDSAAKAPPPAVEEEAEHEELTPPAAGEKEPAGTGGKASAAAPAAPAAEGGARTRISPVARRIASDAGIEIERLQGSGPDGRILRRDVEAALASHRQEATGAPTPPAPVPARPAPQEAIPSRAVAQRPVVAGQQTLSRMRQAIARRMTQSKQTQPHYYLTLDIDMTDAMAFRKQINGSASEEQRVSVNDLIVKACALALERHPKFNAEFHENGLVYHDAINIDIGIALEEGLIAPAILHCGGKTLGQIARESKELVERAKSGHLHAEEYSAGTFTITNLGAYGVEALIGIINPPQAAILGVGTVMPQAVVRDGEVVAREMMKIALSADHRVSDGAEGARFIKEIQGFLENPVSLAL